MSYYCIMVYRYTTPLLSRRMQKSLDTPYKVCSVINVILYLCVIININTSLFKFWLIATQQQRKVSKKFKQVNQLSFRWTLLWQMNASVQNKRWQSEFHLSMLKAVRSQQQCFWVAESRDKCNQSRLCCLKHLYPLPLLWVKQNLNNKTKQLFHSILQKLICTVIRIYLAKHHLLIHLLTIIFPRNK